MEIDDLIQSLPDYAGVIGMWPPTVNKYYIRGSILTPAARNFRETASVFMGANREPLSGPIWCHILAFPPDRRKRDLDNILKAILDVATLCRFWHDDSQINDLYVKRCKVYPKGLIVIQAGMIDGGK